MEKQKRWQFYLILAVIILTLYNILPTIFYYSKPLKQPINAERAHEAANAIISRVDALEGDAVDWLYAFTKQLGIKPVSIEVRQNDPRLIDVTFSNSKDTELFSRILPNAGTYIPFVPSQLNLARELGDTESYKATVVRRLGITLDPAKEDKLFVFSPKYDADGTIAPFYRQIVAERAANLAAALGGTSATAFDMEEIIRAGVGANDDDVVAIARKIVDFDQRAGKEAGIAKRFYTNLGQNVHETADSLVQKFLVRSETLKTSLGSKIDAILADQKKLKEEGKILDPQQNYQLLTLQNQRTTLEAANAAIRKNIASVKEAPKPLLEETISKEILAGYSKMPAGDSVQIVSLDGRNPFVQALAIDWYSDKISLRLYDDVQKIRQIDTASEEGSILKDAVNRQVINAVATASQRSDEVILADEEGYSVTLTSLTNTTGILALDISALAEMQSQQIKEDLVANWFPQQPELARESFPIYDYEAYKALKSENQRLGLVVYAPGIDKGEVPAGFQDGSLYVIGRGLGAIQQKYMDTKESTESQMGLTDLGLLARLLGERGFQGYLGASPGVAPEFANDFIFRLDYYYSPLLKATREDFLVKGNKRFAVLDFTDVEQRILAENKIDDQIQEDLLRWKEEYNAAQVDLRASTRYLVPPPTKNVFWQNLKLSAMKYFRGDDRKVLKWGLDLSGGKTVRIGLRDMNGKPVTNPDDLRQAVNELYTRINKMGVSERTIRIEGNNIILDFPGSQNLSASELIKASTMYFHIVNEKFAESNKALASVVNRFLKGVWDEAVLTNRKDVESVNEIAWRHLGADVEGQSTLPRSEEARILYDNGLRLPNPKDRTASHAFNDTISAVAKQRGDTLAEWQGQEHPLLFVFHNYALDGSSLTNIQVGYDATEGNILTFGIKSAYEGSRDTGGNPRDDFYAWTSEFSEDRIGGTPKETYSNGHGWRMAVILNGSVITKPALRASLRDSASISGRFSQREINQLAADLKAGSLSFTPRILSEENVSPELGQEERTKGIIASLVALVAVVAAMVGYYRFAGLVASCAVILNILIMWGVLQNLDAAVTLPGIAGIVLTIGMAVDANVLVFERVREEFKISGRIASAIQAGYRKAFSAIVDSNITTIIAALILIQFDSGPIRGFAVMLIIGIISSMFTSLFMTRYFFAGWVQNPANKHLTMSQFLGKTSFDFLAQTRKAVIASLVVMLLGSLLFAAQYKSMFGMDFTGGYSLVVELAEKPDTGNYRLLVGQALTAHGAGSTDYQIRELSRANQLRIDLATSMELEGHPFYNLPAEYTDGKYALPYQSNPRIVWVVKALNDAGLPIQKSELDTLDSNWTVVSGQLSDAMRYNAAVGLMIALAAILVYITFRFEFKFALGAVVGLVHDVIITLGILALFHQLGFPVQIDLQVIGAIMTIIGYSLNDTIIVFDRIREDMHIMRKMKFHEICNHALNVTLSRTIMTSGTTLLVLLSMVFLGGKSIFSFSLVMTIGVLVGTFSSLFIATPVMIYFHDKEERQADEAMKARG